MNLPETIIDNIINPAAHLFAYLSIVTALFLCFTFILAWITLTIELIIQVITKTESMVSTQAAPIHRNNTTTAIASTSENDGF